MDRVDNIYTRVVLIRVYNNIRRTLFDQLLPYCFTTGVNFLHECVFHNSIVFYLYMIKKKSMRVD